MRISLSLLLIGLCLESFAAVIIIKGQPTPLEYRDRLYYPPETYIIRPETTNIFITEDGLNKICFINTAPQRMLQQNSEISIVINGIRTDWNCFPYRTTLFEARP